ncbi:mechanosensitive ion channel protein MscS [Thermoplasmatales archaeon SG8-52-1]|nr:MAG: mechanosensitive ion channel protein MscS [Thermoplasmatales archaeon SG8-52-1]
MAIEIAGFGLEEPLPYIGVSIWNIILTIVVLIVGIIVVRIAASTLKKWMIKSKISEILAEFVTRVIRLVLYVFVIGTALGFLGVEIGTALISISVVLGFVLGFALGDTLSNIASGFMIAVTKPFKKGDYVTLNGENGTIENVGISVTELRTVDNKLVIIPNKSAWGSNITNFTRYNTRRVDMELGVGYGDNLDKVIKTTLDVLKSDKRVLSNPAPQVAVSKFADSSVNIVVRPWVKTSDYWNFFFDFKKKIKQTYDKQGISIPFPQMDVHLDKVEK